MKEPIRSHLHKFSIVITLNNIILETHRDNAQVPRMGLSFFCLTGIEKTVGHFHNTIFASPCFLAIVTIHGEVIEGSYESLYFTLYTWKWSSHYSISINLDTLPTTLEWT